MDVEARVWGMQKKETDLDWLVGCRTLAFPPCRYLRVALETHLRRLPSLARGAHSKALQTKSSEDSGLQFLPVQKNFDEI